jgi:hypothetical protein
MAVNRIDREADNRVVAERPKQWAPAELLPEPIKQPGYAYRWVATSILNVPNPRNLSGKLREGWEPVRIEEQPQFTLLLDPDSRFKDNIEIGGLLLCKCPLELVGQRNDYVKQQTENQIKAVDNNLMRQSDSRMPIFKEGRSDVSFGKGN